METEGAATECRPTTFELGHTLQHAKFPFLAGSLQYPNQGHIAPLTRDY